MRIILKFYLPALAVAFCLQRKRWWGWRTTSWIYPSIMREKNMEYVKSWLLWDETYSKPSEREIGIEIAKRK